MTQPILMIDARNCMYRAVHAGRREDERNKAIKEGGGRPRHRPHNFVIMLRLISGWVAKYKPSKVQVFWDTPRASVWRKKIFEGYKDRDSSNFVVDVKDELIETEKVAREFFNHMNVYQFSKHKMEADDLIFAACKIQCRCPIVIASTDADMLQIPYLIHTVKVYNPEKNIEIDTPEHSPTIVKSLMGDKSDMIPGYFKVGIKTAQKLTEDPQLLREFLDKNGSKTYFKNMLLVDLSLCPYLMHNLVYVQKVLAQKPKFDRAALLEMQKSMRISGLMSESSELFSPFRALPE